MSTKTERILGIMRILAWVAFVALMIKAGVILVTYFRTLVHSDVAENIYNGLNMYALRQYDLAGYSAQLLLVVALVAMQGYIALLVARVLSKIGLENPFRMSVALRLERISYWIWALWLVTIMHNALSRYYTSHIPDFTGRTIPGDFIVLAGVVYVFSQVFKKGVEIQSENELTI